VSVNEQINCPPLPIASQLSKRHVQADASIDRMGQWANAVERFAVLRFRWFLANARFAIGRRGLCREGRSLKARWVGRIASYAETDFLQIEGCCIQLDSKAFVEKPGFNNSSSETVSQNSFLPTSPNG
jgi:hypothetical protein